MVGWNPVQELSADVAVNTAWKHLVLTTASHHFHGVEESHLGNSERSYHNLRHSLPCPDPAVARSQEEHEAALALQ